MTTNHIDQLAEWWENAEQGTPRMGDVIIRHNPTDGPNFIILVADEFDADGQDPECWGTRILARAPKPKPAWHDAKAVIASTDYCERQVWERGSLGWYGTAGDTANTEDLRDVTPLIETKITNEMVERGAQASTRAGVRYLHPSEVREVLTAALGLETR